MSGTIGLQMAVHYIYEETPKTGCLCQGDILKRTPELVEVLSQYHLHYSRHPSYRYFIVLTQSCSLVRRDGEPPSSDYITLAAVRPVEEAIRREARKHQDWWQQAVNVLSSSAFDEMVLFVESLFDNNEPNYFFLHEDLSFDISGPVCAFLALSIALRVEHYERCLRAKIAQLKEPFQAKLGWLVGNMYSQVGTQEWDQHYGKGSVRKTASQLLTDLFVNVPQQKIAEGTRELMASADLATFSPEAIFKCVQEKRCKPKITRLSERATEVLSDAHLVDMVSGRAISQLQADTEFATAVKDLLAEKGIEQSDSVRDAVVKRFVEELRAVVSDTSLRGREKIVAKLVGALCQDSIIRNIVG